MNYKMVNLGDIISPAKTIRCGDNQYPVLSMTMRDGLVFQDEKFKKVIASKDTSDYKVVYRNQLVISFPIDEGVLAAQRIVEAGIVSPAYGIWDIDQSQVLPEFLEYSLRCERALSYYKAKLRGSTARRRSLPTPTLLELTVPVPALKKQQQILKIVHASKQIIEDRKKEISVLDDLIKARFVEMFGEPHKNNLYPYLTVSELTDVVSGGTPDRKKAEYWNCGTIPWVKTTELQNSVITEVEERITETGLAESSAKRVPPNTVLIAMYGQGKTRGMTGFLGIDACTNQACACLLPTAKIDMQYLWHFLILSYDELRGMAQGGNQQNLNAGMIKSFPILVPPMEEQKQFISFISQVDKSKAVVQKALDEAQLLLDCLMQQFFG